MDWLCEFGDKRLESTGQSECIPPSRHVGTQGMYMQRFAASSPSRYATDSCGLLEGSMKTALIIPITS